MAQVSLEELFNQLYGKGQQPLKAKAPGRVNLIGEYTDFNGGYVLPCALTVGTELLIRQRDDNLIRLASTNFDLKVETLLDKVAYNQVQDWGNYPLGIVYYLQQQGATLGGFDALFSGSIPNGAGLSSSASIELVVAVALNALFNLGLSRLELIKLAQYSENNFNKVNSGIMDQFAVGLGQHDNAIFLNCQTLDYTYVPLTLGHYRLVIGNTNKRRTLADSKYNERRAEGDQGLAMLKSALPNANYLCDISLQQLQQHKNLISNPTIYRRVYHVISENERVLQAVNYLQQDNLAAFGQLMIASHASLRYNYEVTGHELDTLVDLALQQKGVIGSRMTGAGFGGCTISLVHQDHLQAFIHNVIQAYTATIGYQPSFYLANSGDGASLVP